MRTCIPVWKAYIFKRVICDLAYCRLQMFAKFAKSDGTHKKPLSIDPYIIFHCILLHIEHIKRFMK